MRLYLIAVVAFGKNSVDRICYILNRLNIEYRIVLPDEIPNFAPTHIILSGGPKHVYEEDAYIMPQWVLNAQCPVLGICYGMQLIAHTFGGLVGRMKNKEEGPIEVTEIINSIQTTNIRWMNRYDQVMSVPNIFNVTGVTNMDHIAAFTDNNKWWAVQYHPEGIKYKDVSVFRRFLKTRLNKLDTTINRAIKSDNTSNINL